MMEPPSKPLDPLLPRNRETFARLTRWKRWLLVLFVIALPVAAILAPADEETTVVLALFGALAIAFGVVEWAKYRVFARDLRQRRDDDIGGTPRRP